MAEPLNTSSPTTFTTAVLIGDPISTNANGAISPDSTPQLTQANSLPVAAALEIQSTQGALLIPRMTTTQRDAMSNSSTAITNGMMIYNSTTNAFNFYQSNSWINLATSPVTVPGSTTNNAVVRWANGSGTAVKDSVVLIDDSGNITGAITMTLGVASTQDGQIKFYNSSTNALVTLRTLSASDITWTLPGTDGTNGNPMVTNGSGSLSFASDFINLGVGASADGYITIYNGNNANYVRLITGATGSNIQLTLPTSIFQSVASGTTSVEVVPLSGDATGILGFREAGMCYSNGIIPSASFKTINASPLVLLSAPGPNQAIIIHNLVLELAYGTATYAVAGGGTNGQVYLLYGVTPHDTTNVATLASNIPASFVTSTVSTFIETPGFLNNTTGVANTGMSNKAVSITTLGPNEYTTGDSDITYHIWYSVVSVT